MGWQSGKSYYESVVERALIELSASTPLCSDYRYNRSTWFSGRLRYDFVLGGSLTSTCISPYLIEVHGEQHYHWSHDNGNDAIKKRLAGQWGCPLLEIPYWDAYMVDDKLRDLILHFVAPSCVQSSSSARRTALLVRVQEARHQQMDRASRIPTLLLSSTSFATLQSGSGSFRLVLTDVGSVNSGPLDSGNSGTPKNLQKR